MDPQEVFCPNLGCPARGQVGKGNICIHNREERRYRCSVCHQTFSHRRGTAFFRRRVGEAEITLVLTLLAHGCPIAAIETAFGYQRRTIRAWLLAAGTQAEAMHEENVLCPRELGEVQADEIRARIQKGVLWLAMAIQVSTRLWLGGVASAHRDRHLIDALVSLVRRCALAKPVLVCVDGLATYVQALLGAFTTAERTGRRGRPRRLPWEGLVIAQVVKRRCKGRLVEVLRRVRVGSETLAWHLLWAAQGGGGINTAYIERINATFRARLWVLARRTRGLARTDELMRAGMYLIGAVYNFCTLHASLRLSVGGQRTPAMAAGITDHYWSVSELLWHRVKPPPWTPPKRRGPVPARLRNLQQRWAT